MISTPPRDAVEMSPSGPELDLYTGQRSLSTLNW
jgi:hypothetical protein